VELPDVKKHYIVSMVKSVLRIAGYLFLFKIAPVASVILIVSEVLGVLEENA